MSEKTVEERKYLYQLIGTHGANALSIGIQIVMIAWLAADVLLLTPLQIATVQMGVLVPMLILLPFAGALSDRFHPAQILSLSNLVMALVHIIALFLLWSDKLQFGSLILYGFALSCCNSFIQSAREKFIASINVDQLHRRISLAGMAQQSAQGLGILLAGSADWLSWEGLTSLQASLCLLACLSYFNLMKPVIFKPEPSHIKLNIRQGFVIVWRQVAARHTVAIVAFNGMMQMGMLTVLLPVLARDLMKFRSFEFSLLQLSFAVGGIVVQATILRNRAPKFPGQAILFCLLYAGVIAFALSSGPTFYGLFLLLFLWGCVSGASANFGRLVVQTVVDDSVRGRAMAVYQLALFGSAPIGALLGGWLLTHNDLNYALKVIAYCSGLAFFGSLFTKGLWQVRSESQSTVRNNRSKCD